MSVYGFIFVWSIELYGFFLGGQCPFLFPFRGWTLQELELYLIECRAWGAQLMNCHSEPHTVSCFEVGECAEWVEQLSPRGQWQSIDWCQNHSWSHVILNSNVCLQPLSELISLPPSSSFCLLLLQGRHQSWSSWRKYWHLLYWGAMNLAVSSSEHWKGRLGQGIYEGTHEVWCLEACVTEKQNKHVNIHRCSVQPGSQAQWFVFGVLGRNVGNLLIGTCKIEICVFWGFRCTYVYLGAGIKDCDKPVF